MIAVKTKNQYTYDNNGNLTSYGDWANVWDYMNRLIQSVNSTEGTKSGQRVKKTENGVVSVYPNKYYTIENGVVKKHIFAGDTELASVEGTTTTFHHSDHLSGSSVETDEEGYVVEVLDYYPFGETRLDEKYTTYENDKKFTGHEYDDATGLYYMGARYQDPEIGRFVSEDPAFLSVGDESSLKSVTGLDQQNYLKNPQGLNAYSYSLNNPIKYRDPNGNYIGWDDLAFAGGGGLVSMGFLGINQLVTGNSYGWEDYAGAFVSGAVAGEALLYAPVAGPVSMAVIGGGSNAVGNITKQTLKNFSGKSDSFDYSDFGGDVASGALVNAFGYKFNVKIPGITQGVGSLESISKQLITKLSNGAINSISPSSFTKMGVYSAVSQAGDLLFQQAFEFAHRALGGSNTESSHSNTSLRKQEIKSAN